MVALNAPAALLQRAAAVARACAPAIDLLIRLWLAQLFWMRGLAGLLDWRVALSQAPGFAGVLSTHPRQAAVLLVAAHFALPILLLVGLATRLAALPLLALSLAGLQTTLARDAPILWALLAGWYVVVGAGQLSLDTVVARGIFDTALPLAPALGRLLASLTRLARPAALLPLRAGLSWVLVRHNMVGSGPGLILPALLTAGLATRLATLPLLAISGIAMMHAATNEHLCWTLLLLLTLSQGPGPASLDTLLGIVLRRQLAARHAGPSALDPTLPRIVIVGGGFGGVAAARGLRHARCAVTLIDQHNYHLFQPLLYQVATASLSPADIATPIRSLFATQPNAEIMLGRVTGVDTAGQTVGLESGAALPYDMLVLATGARHAYFGHDDWAGAAPGLKTLDDATSIRRRILLAFERAENTTDPADRQALLTFGVIGGGPTGVELAGAIAELARSGLTGEFRRANPALARILLVQSGKRVLPTFPESLSAAAASSLTELGVDIRLGHAVEDVTLQGMTLAGEHIPCATVFWAAGVAASPAAAWLGASADRSGRLETRPDLTAAGHPNIFAIGDTASVNAWRGKPTPGLAPAAKQAGAYVARVICARLTDRIAPAPFRYHHAGSLATIGRRSAVAEFGRLRMTGPLAWWLWGTVHILFLAGGRNRVVVAVQWFWAYLTYSRGIRLITGK